MALRGIPPVYLDLPYGDSVSQQTPLYPRHSEPAPGAASAGEYDHAPMWPKTRLRVS
ncbi:hypothetical protein IBTHAUMO2_790016 [Nitrosopumilaceae archaeon]|nr:hypothetical protein IBTHAUMO2_790016 [Nitrosopumilaceae archaeon]